MGLERKRKSIDVLQSSDKKKKNIKNDSSEEDSSDDQQSEHDNGVVDEEINKDIPTNIRWPCDDIQKLLSQIEILLPKNDGSTFRTRLSKIDWEKVKFGKYDKDECQTTWMAIQDQLKTFKTLGDLVKDAKNLLATKGIDTNQSKQNRIQKPKSAYMLFYTDYFHKYKKKNPDMKLPQLTQIIADKYKCLSPEKKQTFVDRANKLKTDYQVLMAKSNSGLKSKVESTKPKTPFQVYLEAKYENLEAPFEKSEVLNHYKEKWENMSEKKKSKWIKLAKDREDVYLGHLKEDHKDDPAFTMPTKSALTKGDRKILDSLSGIPKKPPVNNYGLFSKEMLQSDSLAGIPPKEKMATVAKKWKEFSEEEKQIYTDKLKILTDRYRTEFDAYLKTLPEEERQLEMNKAKVKPKKVEPKIVPRINAREGIPEKPKKTAPKTVSKYNSKTKVFDGEPQAIPFKKPLDLFKNHLKNNPKYKPKKSFETQAIAEWTALSDRKKLVFENELKGLKKEYMKNLKEFLGSLSADDLKLYLKLRKPELINDSKEKSDDMSSVSGSSSSSEDDEEEESDAEDEVENSEIY
ncbi:nucleolar transcription factor 1-A-like [Daktulosphaira vitifoliae]|uniref:nucleolar transcription factor 1-A-like n=2 Tax=Daktulosphaira vitifoliae TaxID=58002 RepID=UPI0021A97D1E|nr:nucleolar transcription factor 1-A-like [Daktulosphaira vitifoliae]XP_050542871.1 nucleolar transcription factor 1-A-like [Daktulosphaira vitifoliae]